MKPSFDSMWRRPIPWLMVAMLVTAAPVWSSSEGDVCGVVDIDAIGWQQLQSVKNAEGVDGWIEFGSGLLVCGDPRVVEEIGFVSEIDGATDVTRMWIVRGFGTEDLERMGLRRVMGEPRFGVVYQAGDGEMEEGDFDDRRHRRIVRASRNTVIVRQAANSPARNAESFSPVIQVFVDEVDGDRWYADMATLASYNRYTHGPEILQARDWLVTQFESLPGLVVETFSFPVGGTTAYNVIATLPGTVLGDDWYIVGGHYDSTSEDPDTAAPGAEDNATGCAGVLEMARIFSSHPSQATLKFVCYAGEEQGLYGSYAHVDDLIATNQLSKIKTMVNMDMIGYTVDPDLDCLLETEEFAQSLLDLFTDAANQFTTLRIETDLYAWGSDHVPFLAAGVPAVLTIENDWFFYPYYHTTQDLPQYIITAMGVEILKMNVAVVASLAGTTTVLDFQDGFESGDTSGWSMIIP